MQTSRSGSPWYREPWVWLIVAIPTSAVVMGVVMLTLAGRGYSGLVIDDYYKRGLEINRSLERGRVAAAHDLTGTVRIGAAEETVQLSLAGQGGFAAPPRLTLSLLHATRGGLDRTVELRADGVDRYVGDLGPLEPGAWNLHLTAPGWRLVGRLTVPGSVQARLGPG